MRAPTEPGVRVDVDLRFSVDLPGERTVTGVLTGAGSALELRVSDPHVFAGRSDSRSVSGIARALAAQGVSMTVVAPSGPLVTLGVARAPWWQRAVTGSRHVRLARGKGLWALARGRARARGGALPGVRLAPPPTVWPLLPTFLRRPRAVTTTHDPTAGGRPRLIMAPSPTPLPGERQAVFPLVGEVTTIGSAPECDIRLPGLAAQHAEVRHDDRDEYVLVRLSGAGVTRVNGAPVVSSVLRTASRLQLGQWTLSFYREEYADHGRPYGGRIGGELGHQRPQPPRPHPTGRQR
jgi:hypothetical protein